MCKVNVVKTCQKKQQNYKIMSGNEHPVHQITDKCLKLNTEKVKSEKCTLQRKTTTKFSTMVPKNMSSNETMQEDSQAFDMSSEDDFKSTISHFSINSGASGNDIFFNVNVCQSQEEVSESKDQNRGGNERLTSVTTTSTSMKANMKTGSSHSLILLNKTEDMSK